MSMNPQLIFAPMGALGAITFIVLLLIPLRRIPAAANGELAPSDFALGESVNVPPRIAIVNRAYMNLLEAPILFYVVCLMAFVAARVSQPFLVTAWAYVALRAAHSLVHIAYNNVLHRLIAFGLSNVVLMAMWVMFFVRA